MREKLPYIIIRLYTEEIVLRRNIIPELKITLKKVKLKSP